MDRLWTPWRMQYIMSDKDEGCIFCDKIKEENDEQNFILYRGDSCFIIMNIFPYNNGHIMIAPYRHVAKFTELNDGESSGIMELIKRSEELLSEALKPEGFNIGANLGRCAGAGVIGHVHIHIVPRWGGDTNFMPVLADTKVYPEMLEETYKRLADIITKW